MTVQQFGCNLCNNFYSMQILIFCTLSLKMPIHAPKIGFLRILQNGEQYERDPQTAHLWTETRHMTYKSSKSVHLCALGASRCLKQKNFKKIKKIYLRNHNTCFFTCCPDHPRCRSATWICTCGHTHDVVVYSTFHRNPLRGFGAPRGSKFGFSHYFG